MIDHDDGSVRLPALQAHQISGSVDPRMPTRTLLEKAPAPTQDEDRDHRSATIEASDPASIRRINDRLAPGGLN